MASSTALIQLGARELASMEQGLVTYSGGETALGEPVERRLERLRQDRETHSRKQIWTKDPHGGPYRKVNIKQGYDPLIQLPDGRDRPAELGYERVKTGPTSNFVGNHMTQGAIDLVQAQLEQPARATLLLGAGSGGGPQPLRLLSTSDSTVAAAAAATAAAARPLQQYQWQDDGGNVRVEVAVERIPLGYTAVCSVSCNIQTDQLELLVIAPSPPTVQEACSHGAPLSSSPPPQGTAGACHRLLLHPLHAAVVPASSRCYVKGPSALPPSIQGPNGDGAQKPAAAAPPTTGSNQASITFTMPLRATHIVIELCKADAGQEWSCLQASRTVCAVPAATGASIAAGQPDVVALRRALRQKLCRATAPSEAESTSRSVGAAATTSTQSATDSGAAAAAILSSAELLEACQAALVQAEGLVAAGQHAEALATTAPCLPLLPALPAADASLVLQLRALRGHCQAQLGCLKEAVAEYGAAIQAAQTGGDAGGAAAVPPTAPGMLAQLLVARAALYEQQEKLHDALADAQQAASLQLEQAAVQAVAVQAAERLRRACRRAARM